MSHFCDLNTDGIEGYIKAYIHKGLLRFIICSSVYDVKRPLIDHLSFESKLLFEDELLAIKARRGELKNFTGIDSAYEAPEAPDVHLKTSEMDAEDAANTVIAALRERGMIS